MWKSAEVWPASVVNVPGVRGAVALMMDYDSGKGCKLWSDEIECASEGSTRKVAAAAGAELTATLRKHIQRRVE